jgi:Enoyl-CoA hydratase/isomerase
MQEHVLYNRLDFFPVPTIAAIEGHCLGGGLKLALTCDLRIASEALRLGLPEVKLGVFPAGGGTERLARLIGESRARELIYTGEPVEAREAWRIGLVNRVAPAGQALVAAQELRRTSAARSGLTLRTVKAVLDRGICMDLMEAQQVSVDAISELFQSESVSVAIPVTIDGSGDIARLCGYSRSTRCVRSGETVETEGDVHAVGGWGDIRARTASRAPRTSAQAPPARSMPTTCSLRPPGVAASAASRAKRSVPPDSATQAKVWAMLAV